MCLCEPAKSEIWDMGFVCKLIPGPHEATRCQSLGAPSTVHSQLVPEIINTCFSIKASWIHCNTLTKNRLKHFHLNRYTLVSYICRILQARRSHWHLTYYYGQMLSDFFFLMYVYVIGQRVFPLKSMIASSMSFKNSHNQHIKCLRFGINSTFTLAVFCFYIQSKQIIVL